MQLTKYTHACVRLVVDGTTLVIDPGVNGWLSRGIGSSYRWLRQGASA